jgi:two-component system cell cycle sensor histidine kinase/response regulator CckA
MRLKRRYFFLPLFFLVLGYMFFSVYNDVRDTTIAEFNAQQMLIAKQAAKGIQSLFDQYKRELTYLSSLDPIIPCSDKTKALMQSFLNSRSSEISAVTAVDAKGRIVYTVPYNEKAIGADISYQDHVKTILSTHKAVVSDVFMAVQGYRTVAYHVPIFKKGVYKGSLAILIPFKNIVRKYLEDVRIGNDGYAWVISEKGVELYCPVPEHTGKTVFETYKRFPSIISMAKEMMKGREGSTTYFYDRVKGTSTERMKKLAVYYPIRLGNTFWSIVVATPERYALENVYGFRNKMMGIAGVFLIIGLIFGYYIIRASAVLKEENKRKEAENALKEREALLGLLVRHTPAAVAMCDREMRYLAYSDRWIKDFGLTQENLVGLCHYDVFPDLPEVWKDDHQRCFSGEIISRQEEIFERDDGRTDWVRMELYPWRDSAGEIGGLIQFIEVITERVKARQLLRDSEERYRSVFEHTGTATVIIDEDRIITTANKGFEDLSGFTKDEIQGKMEWTRFVVPEDLERMMKYHDLRRKETGRAPEEYEFRFVDCRGNLKHIFNRVGRIPGTGKSIASLLDISVLKEAQEALQESEKKYRLVVDNANDAIFVAQDGRLKFVNPRTVEMVGYSADELEKMPFVHLIHPDDREMVAERHKRRLQGNIFENVYGFKVIRKDGDTIWVQLNTVLIEWEGHPATINFLRDQTPQKRLEEQLQHAQKMEAVGTLAGGIAHDFNNLLTGIQGSASLALLEADQSGDLIVNLKNIEEYVRKGADLTKQLLGFARGGKYEVRRIDLNEVVKRQNQLFGRTKKEIRIHGKYAEGLWSVEADLGQIEQILLNLYINAWQAMPEGGELYLETQNVTLDKHTVSAHQLRPGKYVKIAVTDTGVGMDRKTRERIFEPFFTTKGMGKGTGLGLASVYGIVKNHDGFIYCYSEVGEGTTFNIYLPATEKKITKEMSLDEKIAGGNETVLVVDDEEMVREVTSSMLKRLGYTFLAARGGKEALEIYAQEGSRIDLVLLDMIMPDLGGGVVFDRLKAKNPDLKVLLSSGYSVTGQAAEILQRGCNGFIQKPFNFGELSRKLRAILDTGKAEAC